MYDEVVKQACNVLARALPLPLPLPLPLGTRTFWDFVWFLRDAMYIK